MHFEFATATRIVWGAGKRVEITPAAAAFGKRALVVTRGSDNATWLVEALRAQNVETRTLPAHGEPTVESIGSGVNAARAFDAQVVIAVGGGSVIDTGKAIAMLLTNGGEPLDYLEVVGRGQPVSKPSAPFIAVPTTAGTGSEVTRNAVLGSPKQRVKASLRSPYMLPHLAVIDPELTYAAPPRLTADAGLDALTQLIEPYTCNAPNALVDALCADGIPRAARALPRACENGNDAAARADMSLAALYSGMALANAKLGAVHGIAGPLGGMLDAPHGALCARLLPFVMETNLRALETRAPGAPQLARYAQVARWLTGDAHATAQDGIAHVRALCAALHVAPLARFGFDGALIPELVPQAQKASSMKGNPLPLTETELRELLEQAR
ncbi:MAG: iron-containing alcohol dehydrogenase [Chloroflexi bacterium]|nr:iron-containing alcohol dehydrogenase [Chloroflexota bacterium]